MSLGTGNSVSVHLDMKLHSYLQIELISTLLLFYVLCTV